MLSERKNKISKQKSNIQFIAFLRKFTKNHLINQNVI